jgi:hypothetical protein
MRTLILIALIAIAALIAVVAYLATTKDGKALFKTVGYTLLGITVFFALGVALLWVMVTIAPMVTAIAAIGTTLAKGLVIVVSYAILFKG